MPKYKITVKVPWPGQTQKVTRQIIIEANSSMTAVLQARGQYGQENVIGGGIEIKEDKVISNNSIKSNNTSYNYHDDIKRIDKDKDDLKKDVIILYTKQYGKKKFEEMIGGDPYKMSYDDVMKFLDKEKRKKTLVGKVEKWVEDDRKHLKEKGFVSWLTKDIKKIGSLVKDKLKKK